MSVEEIAYLRHKAAQFRALARGYGTDGDRLRAAEMAKIAREIAARAEVLQLKQVTTTGIAAKLDEIVHIAERPAGVNIATYRVFFLDQERKIVGRDEFAAPDDAHAIAIAQTLGDACSDECADFELWQSERRIDLDLPEGHMPGADRIVERVQETVVEREIALLESRWAIADSARLLKETARLLTRR